VPQRKAGSVGECPTWRVRRGAPRILRLQRGNQVPSGHRHAEDGLSPARDRSSRVLRLSQLLGRFRCLGTVLLPWHDAREIEDAPIYDSDSSQNLETEPDLCTRPELVKCRPVGRGPRGPRGPRHQRDRYESCVTGQSADLSLSWSVGCAAVEPFPGANTSMNEDAGAAGACALRP
jgi:hypothetical protein